MEDRNHWARGTVLAAALILLNVSLTFQNVWPTPAVTWHGRLSVELAVCILVLAIACRWLGPPSRPALVVLTTLWTVLVIGHYAEVTAPALYGREVNLYWDLRHVSGVAAMLATAGSRWLVILFLVAAVLILAFVYLLLRWGLGRVSNAMSDDRERRILTLLAAVMVVLFVGQRSVPRLPEAHLFSPPVTEVYGDQIRLVLHARAAAGNASLVAPGPAMSSDLERVKGADVVMLFVEAYGAITYDRPAFAQGLSPSRARLQTAIGDTGRHVVSAFVESPTFGGNSWLAHINMLSGVEVKDPDTNSLLMTQKRDTLVRAFARRGYRTVGVMPGTWQAWPEGLFYGFDEIYGGDRLAYHGTEFGWWDIPDQYALAKMDELEMNRTPRAPVFVFFPMISSHIPFSPVPPYQADWTRLLTDDPYDAVDLKKAFANGPDWMDLGPNYVNALSYINDTVAGYLRTRADKDFVMIMIGDHQPAAVVTGEGASWDVPVHVIASRQAVLDRLLAHGFRAGLTPQRPVLSRMYKLLPMLLDAFGDR